MLLFMYFRLLQAVVNQSLNLCYLVIYSFCLFTHQFSIIV